ncbi:inositol polyphosphate 5-phosphatase [Dinochytrium kinnereticum]|nr:inositol polyphosphate 5-phosphatase [Dinochytrium kinnereticum]
MEMHEAEQPATVDDAAAATPPPATDALRPSDPPEKKQNFQYETMKVEVRKGKVTFKEQRLPVERHPETIKELHEFHQARQTQWTSIPIQHHALVAKLIQDSSLTITQLAKDVRCILFASDFGLDTDAMSESVVSELIQSLASRINYGLDEDGNSLKNSSYFVWDVRDRSLLGSLKSFFDDRLTARIKAKSWLELIHRGTFSVLASNNMTPEAKKSPQDVDIPISVPPSRNKEKKTKSSSKAIRAEDKVEKSLSVKGDKSLLSKSFVDEVLPDSDIMVFRSRFLPFHVKQDVHLADHNRFFSTSGTGLFPSSLGEDDFAKLKEEFFTFCKSARRPKRVREKAMADSTTLLSGAQKWKFLKYAEDYRPPYFGTLRKKKFRVSGRCPWKRDAENINYDVDSEEEWEEEEPGEELLSEDEDDAVEEEDANEQDDFVVEDDGEDGSTKAHNLSKKKRVIVQLTPVVIFPWSRESAPNMLEDYQRCWFVANPTLDPFKDINPPSVNENVNGVFKSNDDFVAFISCVESLSGPIPKIVESFKERFLLDRLPICQIFTSGRFPYLSKSAIESQLKEVACKESGGVEKGRWRVKEEYTSNLPASASKKRKAVPESVTCDFCSPLQVPISGQSEIVRGSSIHTPSAGHRQTIGLRSSLEDCKAQALRTRQHEDSAKDAAGENPFSDDAGYRSWTGGSGLIESEDGPSLAVCKNTSVDMPLGSEATLTDDRSSITDLPVYIDSANHLNLNNPGKLPSFLRVYIATWNMNGKVATGIGRILGNKGAVIIGFRIRDFKIVLINSHLAAHHNRVDARNRNYFKVVEELKNRGVNIGDQRGEGDPPNCVFWFGDLNYRINGTRTLVEALVMQNRLEVLRNNDQLRIEMKKGRAFNGFMEGQLQFLPTYKFDTSTAHQDPAACRYDTSKKGRIPSWTDRILVKSMKGGGIESPPNDFASTSKPKTTHGVKIEKYSSNHDVTFSDHKPVFGIFNVAVNFILPSLLHIIASDKEYKSDQLLFRHASKTFKRNRIILLSQEVDERRVFTYAMHASELVVTWQDASRGPERYVYIEKLDSTGLGARPADGSVARALVHGYLSFCVEEFRDYPLTVSVFARAAPQYLFHKSAENKEKHTLSDSQLIAWWIKTLNGWTTVDGVSMRYHWFVPGEDQNTFASIFHRLQKRRDWNWGLPFDDEAVAKDVIPTLPDDVKTTCLEISEERTTVKEFKELLLATKDCGSGKLAGLINVLVLKRSGSDVPKPLQTSEDRDQEFLEFLRLLSEQGFSGVAEAIASTGSILNYLGKMKQVVDITIPRSSNIAAETKKETSKRPLQETVVNDLSSLVKKKPKHQLSNSEPKVNDLTSLIKKKPK